MANKPNNPSLWSKAKSLARQKFDVYPSAYANGWAAKWYKGKGGTWRKAEYGMEMPLYKAETGFPGETPGLTPREMEEWNRLIDFASQKGLSGSRTLDNRSKNIGRGLFDEYRQMYPDTVINYDIVPRAQREFLEFQKNNQKFKDERGIKRKDQFDNLSAEDGWFGSFTSKQKFVPLIERIVDESGREISRIDMGLMNREGIPSSRRTASGSLKGFIPPPGADIQTWSDGKNYIIDPNSGDAVEVGQFAKQGNRFLKNGGESNNNLPKAAFGMLLLPGMMNRVNKAKETIKDNPQLLNLIAPGAGSMGSMAGMMQKGGEADGGMALQQMSAVMDKLGKLRKFIKPNSDLEPWISSKLAVMDHYADAVSDYMTYGDQYQDGGDVVNEYSPNLPQMQGGGQCPEGFVFLEEVGDCVPMDMFGPEVAPTRGNTRTGIELSYPKFSLGYNYSTDPFGRKTHDMRFSLPEVFRKRGSLNLSGNYVPGQSWAANLDSDFRFGKRDAERAPRLTLNASVDKFFGDPELSEMSRMERLLPPQKALNYNIEAGLNIPMRKQGNLKISGSYGKRAMQRGGWLNEYK